MNFKIKVLWLENSLGLAIDQINSNVSTQLTAYYFWPKTDAWEQLKAEINSKRWIEEQERILLLKNISELMNHWQINRKEQILKNFNLQNKKIDLVGFNTT